MRRITAWILALTMMVSLLSGCGSSEGEYVPTGNALLMEGQDPEDLEPEEEELQELTLCYYPDFSMNPLEGVNITNRVLFSMMYQGLFCTDRRNNTYPILCSYYQVSADSRNWTIYVEDKATFSDGTRVTNQDVVASYEAARTKDYYRGRFTYIDSVEAIDNNAVVFHLTTAYQNLALLLDIPIVKASQVGEKHPLGSGPYCFTEGKNGASLNRVAHWWCDIKLPTNAESIPLVEAGSQSQVRDAFQFGDLDLAISNPMSDSYAEYRCDYELWEIENGIFLYLSFNMLWSDFFKDGKNEQIRKAMTYAIDRDLLVADYYHGRGQASTLPVSPGSPYYSESLAARYVYDPMRFVDALQSAVIPKDSKGNEKKLLLLVNCDDSARLRAARAIAKHLTELGLTTGTLEYGATTGTTYEQVLRAGSYDMVLGQTKLPPTMDLSEFFRGWGNLSGNVLTDGTLLNMCRESLANSGNYYNLCKMVADDAKVVPVMFGCYEVYAERGQFLDLAPSRDNVFFYTLDKTMESARIATEYN